MKYLRDSFMDKLKELYGRNCFYCHGNRAITIDHFIPKSQGGLLNFTNSRPCCSKCNMFKTNLSMEDWLVKINKEILSTQKKLKYLETLKVNVGKIIIKD